MASTAPQNRAPSRSSQRGQSDADWQALMRESVRRSGALILSIALFALAAFTLLSLLSFTATDNAFSAAAAGAPGNWMGQGGAYVADGLLFMFGWAAVLFLPLIAVTAKRLWIAEPLPRVRRQVGLTALGAFIAATGLSLVTDPASLTAPAGWGGLPAMLLARGVSALASFAGGYELAVSVTVAIVAMLGGLFLSYRALRLANAPRLPSMPRLGWSRTKALPKPAAEAAFDDDYDFDPNFGDAPFDMETPKSAAAKAAPRKRVEPDHRPPPVISDRQVAPQPANLSSAKQGDFFGNYVLPSIDLLDVAKPLEAPRLDKAALERNARLLESVLDDFHVKGQITAVKPGPVVTMYELEPAPGIRANRVIALAEDIARNMSALSARVSTVHGRTVMGIELPNANREPVVFHEMVGSSAFANMNGSLPIILGKNINGDPVIADLAPMPHLLVAGTTGSGKSVGLNCMIVSLLYRLTPEQCRMIMIDPKMLELSTYDDIPHLLSPVVTEPAKAIRALKWAVEQMEDRYRMMSSLSVRNLANYNEKVKAAKAKGQPLGRKVQVGYDPATGMPQYEEEQLPYEVLPQIVIIVDELADLMMTAGKEVEFLIQRLAQKARAAGIHLIMATQRPSVDVITGVIKANMPTRISFHVTSKIDSRTILNEQGAEQLLGKGDMLYMAGGKGLTRIHGPFVSDDEVRRVADHWRGQGQPDYISAVTEEPDEGSFALDGMEPSNPEDATYAKACHVVFTSQKASTSWIQRQLRIGYNSAARLIDRMEEDGYVSAPNHVGRREVLRDQNGEPQ